MKLILGLIATFIVVSLFTAGGVGNSNSVVTTTLETTTAPVVETDTVEVTEVITTEISTTEVSTEIPTKSTVFKVTAYCACMQCCGKTDGITATGTKATQGRTIAVDPTVIPYGTEIILNGNTYVAEDCGGAIKGENRIDMFFDNHQDALEWGVQYVEGVVV